MRKLAKGLLAGVLVLSGAACGDPGDGGGGEKGIDALLAAADAVQDAGSSRIEGTMEIGGAGQTFTMLMEGEFDYDAEIGTMTMTMDGGDTAGLPGFDEPLEMVMDGDVAYMRGEALAPALGGAEWGRISLAGAGGSQFQDPTQFVEWLRGAGDVEEVGEEEVRGTATTHYRTVLTVQDILDNAVDEESADRLRAQLETLGSAGTEVGDIPLDAWIDADGLPRRIDVSMDMEGSDTTGDFSFEMFDYGLKVDIEVPTDFKDISGLAG